MLNMFSKLVKGKQKLDGQEDAVSSNELFGTEGQDEAETAPVKTDLSLHPNWNLPEDEKYVYKFLNNECPPLQANQVSLYGIRHQVINENYQITAFVRNALSKKIKFEKVTLLIVNKKDEVLGRKEFDLSRIGEIPAKSSRPWHFTFEQEHLNVESLPEQDWKLAFEIKKEKNHKLDLPESWAKTISDEQKQALENLVEKAPALKPSQIDFMGISAAFNKEDNLVVTALIRNGSHKDINLQKLPLIVEDASNQVVAQGMFAFEEFKVKANTSKPWSFVFPKEMVKINNPDFSKWRVYPKK